MAVRLPTGVRERLEELDRPEVGGVRWTAPARWHVTVRFLGDVGVRPAIEALARIEAPAADVALGPEVGWLGRGVVQLPVSGLDRLAAAVDTAMDGVAPPRRRPFVGHLTLGRARGRRPDLDLVGTPVTCRFRAEQVSLLGSRTGPGRAPARYETLAERSLGG